LIHTLGANRWLLAACGVLGAVLSVIYLLMQATNGPLTFHSWRRTIVVQGVLALAAGACAIAAGLLRSKNGRCWLMAMNGGALGALGVIQVGFTRVPISFLTIALLVIVMAVCLGVLELGIARGMRRQGRVADGWFFAFAGVVSIGFAAAFLALGLRWTGIEPGSHADLLWLGAYFGFGAICMLAMALHRNAL
jgi:hypothetical protein